ncbi:HEAT repeat domain-containing protein [Gemmatimonas sp.]|uniref:HEAT repeat domain-containing protein n=1 Tax=Gemmatimonas sp. TaxID=1962908 RepID=UPI003342D5B9
MPFEIVYVAALAMLLRQLRERAATTEVLSSVNRLCALVHVGNVTIDQRVFNDADAIDATRESAQFLRALLMEHGITAVDIASTVTDTELLKLGGILVGPPSSVRGAILESVDAMSIWNVRLRAEGLPLRPTPRGMAAVAPATVNAASAGAAATAAVTTPPKVGHDVIEQSATAAVTRGDGKAVFKLLDAIDEPVLLEQLATPSALQLIVELLLDAKTDHEPVQAFLLRSGVPGARAVFEQLIAATELADRRFLYDIAASMPATLAVARQYSASPTWFVARNAAGLLGEMKNQSAIPDLSRLLKHSDLRVRIAAVVALGQIGGPTAMARLESVLFDNSPDVRNRALSIVFAAPDADPLADRLMLAVQEESAIDYQLEIISALSHVQTPRARQKLIELTAERSRSLDDLQIRLAAINALAAGHRPAADAALKTLTQDERSLIRERAQAVLSN